MSETTIKSEGNQLTITRTFQAPIALVWRAFTEADLLDQWWAPKPWQSLTKRMDFREGGSRLYAMRGPEGEEHWCITNFQSIVKEIKLSGEDAFCQDESGAINFDFPVAQFENHFQANGNTTLVTIVTEYASAEHLQQVIQMGIEEGLTMAYEGLDAVLRQLQG